MRLAIIISVLVLFGCNSGGSDSDISPPVEPPIPPVEPPIPPVEPPIPPVEERLTWGESNWNESDWE